MNEYISANETLGKTDAQSIINAIKKAKSEGVNRVVIPKRNERTNSDLWVIDETVYLPSDIEILIDGAHLRLDDDTYINMFATENLKHCTKEEMQNIKIHGRDGAVLDGGKYNGLSERNCLKDGRPHISVNTMLLFHNTKKLSVTDLKIINQRWWAVTNVFVSDSEYKNIEFKADLSRVDENGVHYPDELPRNYEETYVKNGDGINLRLGCNNVLIENITGFTEDDTVALTALSGRLEKSLLVENKPTDICNVTVRKIHSDSYMCANVRLLWGDSNKLHDIYIEDVCDMRTCEQYRSSNSIHLGDATYLKTEPRMGDAYNITIKKLRSKAKSGVCAKTFVKDIVIEDIEVLEDAFPFTSAAYCVLENVTLRDLKIMK